MIPFEQVPPLFPVPLSLTAYVPGSERYQVLEEEVRSMLQKGAIEPLMDEFQGFYNRLFVVPKKTGDWRPVLDVSVLNKFVRLTPFKMETPSSVLAAIQRADWMTSIDLKDAYFQIPVHPESRKYLRFMFGGGVYQFRSLCFGLSTAPQVFTRVFAQVAKWLHLVNVRVLFYLDDWLVLGRSRAQVEEATRCVLQTSQDLGILVNPAKSSLVPTQKAIYLGMEIDTLRFWVSPRERRVSNFLTLLDVFLSSASPSAKMWQQVLGHMVSLERFVPFARLRMRPLQFHLRANWDMVSLPKTTLISVPPDLLPDLVWWNSRPRPVFGCFHAGLGGDPGGSGDLRSLESGGVEPSHQRPGTSGDSSGSASLGLSCDRRGGGGLLGQHHGFGLREESGRYPFSAALPGSQVSSPLGGVAVSDAPDLLRPGGDECPGGRVESPESDSAD